MTRMSVIPACTASSTTYWMAGLSTTGSISLGEAFVAGRNRVPNPAAGTTAFLTFATRLLPRDRRTREGVEVYPTTRTLLTLPGDPPNASFYYRHRRAAGRSIRGEGRAPRPDAHVPRGHPA